MAALLLGFLSPVAWSAPLGVTGRDGDVLAFDGPVQVGVVGGVAAAGDAAERDLRGQTLAVLFTTGSAVQRGSDSAYEALQTRFGDLPLSPLPGAGEMVRDRKLKTFARTFAGLGVRGLPHPVTWRAFDVVTDGVPWRFVVLDADLDRLGPRFDDETFWLPKVLKVDHPIVLVVNQPIDSLSAGSPTSRGAHQLHALVRRHADPTKVTLLLFGGGGAPEMALPGGPWGEAWVGAGTVAGPAGTLRRASSSLALAPGLDVALERHFGGPVEDAAFSADQHPVLGWWHLTLEGPALRVALRSAAPDGAFGEIFASTWTTDAGWRPVSPK